MCSTTAVQSVSYTGASDLWKWICRSWHPTLLRGSLLPPTHLAPRPVHNVALPGLPSGVKGLKVSFLHLRQALRSLNSWRCLADVSEPAGPKTLCNACGVKRVRQMRTVLDGSKRRSTKSPAALHKQDSSDLPLSDDYYEPRDLANKRPLRKVGMLPLLLPNCCSLLAANSDWYVSPDTLVACSGCSKGCCKSGRLCQQGRVRRGRGGVLLPLFPRHRLGVFSTPAPVQPAYSF